MNDKMKNELVLQLKKEVHSHSDVLEVEKEELKRIIAYTLEKKVTAFKGIDEQLYIELKGLNFKEKNDIIQKVLHGIRGLGVLGEILEDDDITEIMINGHENIFIEKDGKLQKLNKTFESEEQLGIIIQKFVSDNGRTINQSEPVVDSRLSDGSRVNVVIPPVALNGPTVTIRKFSKSTMTIDKLIKYGSITEDVANVLDVLVKSKYNIFVCGGTGSGKTTFLNALSNYIPRDERVITIEESAELQIRNIDNLVRLETKNAGADGSGAIKIRDLIKSSLRMRPERIVVGEVRGSEALDMLQAMNTGHDGSLSTGHANSTFDMLSRLETMVLQGADGLPVEAIRQQIASAIDIMIHLSRLRDKSRKTMEIVEVLGFDNETKTVKINHLYKFIESDESTKEKVVGKLTRTSNKMQNTYKLQLAGYKLEI